MKKIIYSLLLIICTCISCNAQNVYSKIEQFDKFNDLIATQNAKTLITENDSVITIETKGYKPLVYDIIHRKWLGTKDNPINLVFDVWGYETQYYTIQSKIIVIRTITDKNGNFLDKIAWLEIEDGDRLIYKLK